MLYISIISKSGKTISSIGQGEKRYCLKLRLDFRLRYTLCEDCRAADMKIILQPLRSEELYATIKSYKKDL